MTKYINFPDCKLEKNGYEIVSIRPQDIENIRVWRNEQIKFLRQNKPLTQEEQIAYYKNHIWSSFNEKEPKQILVSFLYNGELIGYGGLVHISWQDKRAEVSFLNETTRAFPSPDYTQDFITFLYLIKKLAFDFYGFNKITTETFDVRPFAVKLLEDNDFVLEGRLKRHIFIEKQFVDSLIHGCFNSK